MKEWIESCTNRSIDGWELALVVWFPSATAGGTGPRCSTTFVCNFKVFCFFGRNSCLSVVHGWFHVPLAWPSRRLSFLLWYQSQQTCGGRHICQYYPTRLTHLCYAHNLLHCIQLQTNDTYTKPVFDKSSNLEGRIRLLFDLAVRTRSGQARTSIVQQHHGCNRDKGLEVHAVWNPWRSVRMSTTWW